MNTSERNLAKDTLAPEQPGIEPPTSHLVDDLNSKKGDNEKRIVSTSDSFSTCCSLSTNSYCHSLLIFIKLLDYWRFLGWVYAVKTNTYHCLRSNTDPLKPRMTELSQWSHNWRHQQLWLNDTDRIPGKETDSCHTITFWIYCTHECNAVTGRISS